MMRAATYLSLLFSACVTACAFNPAPVCPSAAVHGTTRDVDKAFKDAGKTGNLNSGSAPTSSLRGSRAAFTVSNGTTGCQP
jgi:hypothetical protein